jgi:RNA polymerase sigma factor (sigma-70 family)
MNRIEQLVKEYKQEKTQSKLNQIVTILKPVVFKKAKYIHEKKFYPLSLYHKCIECRKCIEKIDCENCERCRCVKGTFNLKRKGLCDLADVENDLWLEILRVIENYDITKNFETYLYATLWDWIPSFINKNYIKELLNISLENSSEETENIASKQIFQPTEIIEVAEKVLSPKEKELFYILLKDNKLTELEISKKLNIDQSVVSRRLTALRKKLKKEIA